jgi:hypothetical protein
VRAFESFVPDATGRTEEVRIWWVGGAAVVITPHPDAPAGPAVEVPTDVRELVGASVRALGAPFVTTDLAPRSDGVWRVIEVGDGQVSDLPSAEDPGPLFRALAAAASGSHTWTRPVVGLRPGHLGPGDGMTCPPTG